MHNSVCDATAASSGRGAADGARSARRIAKLGLATGAALAMSLFAATGAQAQCTATGTAAVIGGFNLAPFASGGSVNALLSAINAANTVFLTQSTAFVSAPGNPKPYQTGGGVWARGIGGEQDSKSTAISNYNFLGAPVSGNITCQTKTHLTFGGVQIGTDISTLNVDGWNLHAGSTLGYLGATGKDTTAPGAINPTGGSLSDSLQVPFIGIYGAATKGGLFLSGQARWLYFQNKLTDTQNGLFGQNLDARGFAINGDIGYHIALPNNWFLEPSAGFIWSETSVDPLNTSGTFVLGTGFSPPGTVTIGNIYSSIGRVSLRAGTTVDAGDVILQPFGTASFFREFEGNPSASIDASVFGITGNLATTGVGNYGQFGLGLAGQIKNTGWLGYIRTDYRTGDKLDGWSVNGGVRYQFSPDMPAQPLITKGPAPEPVETVYNWTGFHVGAMLGADWGYTDWTSVNLGTTTKPRFAGVLPGGFIGYDYQIGKWVVGAGADIGWTNAHGASACPGGLGFYFTCENQMNWLTTVTGRLGYTFWGDRILTYGRAGLAVGDFETKITCNTGALPLAGLGLGTIPGCPGQSARKTATGWTVGLGTEFALTKNWSVRSETDYFDFGKGRYQPLAFAGAANPVDVYRHGFMATIGVAYRFDFTQPPAPILAKY